MKNTQRGSTVLWVVLAVVIIIAIIFYYINHVASTQVEATPTPTPSSSVVAPTPTPSASVSVAPKYPIVGSATSAGLIANRLSVYGYNAKTAYVNLSDLITDIRAKNLPTVRVVGNVLVANTSGYEMNLGGTAAVWVEKGTKIYTVTYDKASPLSQSDKIAVANIALE